MTPPEIRPVRHEDLIKQVCDELFSNRDGMYKLIGRRQKVFLKESSVCSMS